MPELTSDQRSTRATRIGASDISAIAGLNPFRNGWSILNDKLGIDQPSPIDEGTAWWGHAVEELLIKRYEKETGLKTIHVGATVVHPERDWMCATVDSRVVQPARNVECKFVGARMVYDWDPNDDAGMPHYVIAQCTWAMEVTGQRECDVPVLLGGPSGFRIFRLAYQHDLATYLVDIGERFYRKHMVERQPLDFDGSPEAKAWLQQKYPRVEHDALAEADATCDELARMRILAASKEKDGAADKKRIDQLIMDHLGARAGMRGDGYSVTFRPTKASGGERTYRFTGKGQ